MAEYEEVLNNILTKVANEQGYENCKTSTNKISSDGANFTGLLYLVTLSAPQKSDLKLFVKVAAASEQIRTVFQNIFEKENFAYNQLLKTYKEIEEKHNVATEHRLVIPKFYACSQEYLREAIVLEDLTASGYTTHDRFKSVNWEYASKSVQNLAKLHALSIAWAIEDPEAFEKTEAIKMHTNFDYVMSYLKTVVASTIQVTREENRDRLSKFAKELLNDTRKNNITSFYAPLKRPVVAHGDYRLSNLMHKVHEDGTVDIISIDYQAVQRANPIMDLMYFIFTGSDKNFRDKHFWQTLDHYYTELRDALHRLDLDPDKLYPRDDFDYELKQVLPFGLATAMFSLLMITVDAQEIPELGTDIKITDFPTKPNALYTERINDIIDDFVKMNVI